jgi:hypothetical protein
VAVSAKVYAKGLMNAMGGDASGDGPMDLLSDTIKFSLHTNSYTPNQSTNEVKTDATNELSTAGGYTALGVTVASKTFVSSSLVVTFDSADPAWTATTITHRIGVMWDDSVATPTDPLLMYVDNGADVTTASSDLTYVVNASGWFALTAS